MAQPSCQTFHNPPSFSLVNLGCKVNRVEADQIEFDLLKSGLVRREAHQADCIIINTCAVTGEAETKARKAVRQACRQPQNPWVVVTGCAASLHHDAYAALGPRVLISTDKEQILSVVLELLGVQDSYANTLATLDDNLAPTTFANRRLGIKVQDGCNNRCTYCIVWKARGPARSFESHQVLQRVQEAINLGVQEVVLTGINLGSYLDNSCTLAGLTQLILTTTSIGRLRLSSIEPLDITDELIDVISQSGSRVASHLHIPLQSGSNRVLRAMDRLYTVAQFEDRINALREALPNVSISTDIICGFPGETDDDFDATLDLATRCKFSKIHVFRFSARPGTPAFDMPEQVHPQIIASRARRLRELSLELRVNDARSRINTTEGLLIETLAPQTQGTSDSYHRVQVINAYDNAGNAVVSVGDLAQVRFVSVDSTGLVQAVLLKET